MARYPQDYDAFQEKRDNVDDVVALDINEAYYSILAMQGTMGLNPQGEDAPAGFTLADRLNASLDSLGRIRAETIEADMYKNQAVTGRAMYQGASFSFKSLNIGGFLNIYYTGAGTPGYKGTTIDESGNITADGSVKTNTGFEPARFTEAEILAISNPPVGFLVYDTTNSLYKSWNGSDWAGLGGSIVSEATDFDDLPAQGKLTILATSGVTANCPLDITEVWVVDCSKYNDEKIQIAHAFRRPGLVMTRSYDGASWSDWNAPYSQYYEGL